MGKRKRNSVNPFKKEKERASKKGNPIYRVAGAGLKAKSGSRKEVNLHNQALVEALDKQLGEQQKELALKKPAEKKPTDVPKKPAKASAALPEEKSVDERVDDLSESLMLS
ncbi:uncharacterized protein LOC119094841 [Pollicipes pollicipes]|uniref:uncharacterized protein LOC119094841 n=1 Tax=Pollicipes pollicipes TaxID=41117 RepID=UPI0018857FD0|nr:uncharacterized protein LOC119094841 [Pollicipes pollicipes]XP_037073656.1 uncharacterized protein LOC119094841 [Pollicipes pollicipes]XP_037073657.1 uncharacterized protein LOC119094841 [Pollicipes pollicipes]XP_037073658.1 uncharacterized protein LOC119094841 [Pollicipes pollicipes]